jgi:ankyrin repeat protein
MRAAGTGRLDLVEALLAAGADVSATDERDYTALFHACYNADRDEGDAALVQRLIDAGSDVEARIGFGVTPLMYAAGNGEAAVVRTLLDAGADPMVRNEVGRTALMMVKDRDYIDVINILHEAEALIEAGSGGSCGSRNAPDMQVITFRQPPGRDHP